MQKTISIVGIAICIICAAVISYDITLQRDATPTQDLTLSDYPRLLMKDVVIDENASQIEIESAEAIAANLKNLICNKPEIILSKKIESYIYIYNLISLDALKSNKVFEKGYNMADATRVIGEYRGENRGILEIFKNTRTEDVILSGYASAVDLLPHTIVSHTKGEEGADFRTHMHDPHTWNASINNTGNVTLTNIKVIIGEKVIQEIPNLEVGKQNDLVTLQSWEYPKNSMLHIICDQGVKEEIELSHTTVGLPLPGSTPYNKMRYNKFKWVFALPGIILSILGFVGGLLMRKKRKPLILCRIVLGIGILFLILAGLNYVYLYHDVL